MVESGRKESESPYFKKEKFIPKWLADDISQDYHFLTHVESHVLWIYRNGYYVVGGEEVIQEECRKRLSDLSKEYMVKEVVEHIRQTSFLPAAGFEAPPNLVNVKNGVLDLKAGKLSPHDPDLVFTQQIPVFFEKDAGCPEIVKFFKEVVHEEDVPLLQEFFGYCLLREYPFARAVMLLGSGQNGKTQVLNILTNMLGEENCVGPSLQQLVNKTFAMAELYGKLANVHGDLPRTKLQSTGAFKLLTGGDRIYARPIYKKGFHFNNYAKLIYSANELPEVTDNTIAFWRRWIVITFPHEFPEGAPGVIPDIALKLSTDENLSGLLNWALEGLKRLLERGGFTSTSTMEDIEAQWLLRSDSLAAFVHFHVTSDPKYYITKEDFYREYQAFCGDMELKCKGKAEVTKQLPTLVHTAREFRPRIDEKQVKSWSGVLLQHSIDENGEEMWGKTEDLKYLSPVSSIISYMLDSRREKKYNTYIERDFNKPTHRTQVFNPSPFDNSESENDDTENSDDNNERVKIANGKMQEIMQIAKYVEKVNYTTIDSVACVLEDLFDGDDEAAETWFKKACENQWLPFTLSMDGRVTRK